MIDLTELWEEARMNDSLRRENERLRALVGELLEALERIGGLECGAIDPAAGIAMFNIARDIARDAIAKAKGET